MERVRYYAFLGFDLMLGASGVLTLLVGAVGVGNIMFLRVRQRTREIGIQMAVGAKPRRVLRQIIGESLLLVACGGAAGFALSCAVTGIVAATPLVEIVGVPRISPGLAAGTVALLGAVGVVAGYFPARRAARIDPVRALAG
jgi:putative ABC transport system permease protein